MNKSEDVLNAAGVSMKNLNGETRDVSDIMDELASKWNGLSKETQQNTAVNLAGRYQLTRFLALMQNYNISLSATETALHSQGSATRENEKYMQSLEARIQKMKTAWETLSIAFGEAVISDTIITLTSLFASMLNGTASLVKEFGALPVVLGAVGVGIAILRPKLAALIWDFTKTNITMLATSPASAAASLGMKTLAGAATVARGAVTALKFALKALLASTIIGGAFVLLGSALEWIVGKFSDATTATEDFSDKTEELNQKQYDLANLKALSKEYNELSKKTELSFQEKSRLAQVESELSSKYNITTKSVDGQTKSLQENNKAIQTQIDLREDELKAARLAAEIEYNSNADKIDKDIKREKDALIEREKAYDDALAKYEANKKEWAKYDPVTQSYEYGMGKSANESLAANLKKESKLLTDSKTSLQTAMNAKVLAYKSASQSFIDEQEANNVKVKGLTRQFMDIYARAAAESGVSDDKLKSNLGEVFRSIQGKDLANAEEGINLLKQMPGIMNLTSTSYKDMMAAMSQYSYSPVVEGVESLDGAFNDFNLTLEETVERTDEMSQKISETATFVSETKKEISVLNTAQEELAKGNRLSTDTIKKMNDKYEDFIKVTGLSKDAIKKYVAAKKEERISVVNEEINKTKTTIEETKKRIKAYEIEMAAWESRRKVEASAKIDELNAQLEAGLINEQQAEQMFGVYRRNQSGVDSKGNVINNNTTSAYAMERVALKDLMADLSLLESAKNDLTIASNESSKATKDATKSNDKSKESYTDSYEILTKTQKKLLELADAIKKVQSERNTMVKGSKQYIDSLKEEKKLVEQQIAAQEKALKNPSELVSTKVKTTTTTTPSDTSSSTSSSTSSNSGTKLDNLLSNALGLQGKFTYKQVSGKFKGTYDQFVKGAISDCSQFVQEMFDEFLGINLPRTAAEQAKQGVAVQKADLKKGDLVFFNTTGKANSHVGIYTGNGKFIQMGNSGLKEQSLDSSYWAPKYQGAKRVNGVGESSSPSTPASTSNASKTKTTSSDGKTVTETTKATQKELDDAVRDTKADILSGKSQAYQLGLDIVDAVIAGTDNQIAKLQAKRDLSSNKQSRFTQDSAEWRKEEMSQSSLLQQEQKLIEQQNKDIRQQLMEQKITQGEYDAKIAENSAKWWDYQSQIDEKRKNVFDSQLSAYDKQIKTDDDSLVISEAKLKLMTEGTVEYTKELQNQIPVLEHKSAVLTKEIEYTKSLIANNKNNAVMTAYYNERLQELNLSLLDSNSALADVNKTLKDMRESAADNIIEEYKKVIEQQRDLALDALDQEIKKENERHEERTKNIDDEQKQFENYINARLKAFDRENASTDYTEELTKKMDERQKIQDRINVLSADNSMAGKAKRKELEDQLVTIDEEIRKYQRDRDRELVKQGLQDQLDDHKNYNDKIKDGEDKLHDDTLDKLDEEKKKTERKYKDILENQKYFYDLKQGLMSNDATIVTATLGIIGREYDKLFATIKDHTFETSQAMQNMVYNFQKSMESLNKYSSGDYSAPDSGSSSGSNGGTTGSTGTIKGTTAARVAWTEYLSNKQSAESIKAEMSKLDKASSQYKNLTQQFDSLKSKNDQLRSVYGFPDGSFKDLVTQKIFSAETGGMTPAGIGKEGKFLLAHEKELVLNKTDTSNVLKIVDVVRGITDKIKNGLDFSGLFSKATPTSSTNDNRIQIEKVEIHATDKDTGTSILSKLGDAVNKQMRTRMI
ncbi:C40 family peptidase [Paenibacillus barcinonensis]|uniref:C40 family peptidase n=1 Tax=Paenibacillus barcinonensis TaxID=198119 RepID=A0A2V4VDK0_PAEBA|nr:NlpC/P60 family protein [Paenibacillus barcinonensis]PYE51652.1 cell wall-associated NlpC family hydrolase [Paenibacillus barcinonensis]QKS56013.1 C40 family peptidase [Paenibacillus barcinonensis]